MFTRRQFSASAGAIASTTLLPHQETRGAENPQHQYQPKYILGSCMYGYTKLEAIVPEVKKIGATAIDIWPKVHGDQREQLQAMGEDRFKKLIDSHQVKLGCITQYKLGPFGLQQEMKLAQRLGCQTMVTGGKGPKGLKGKELKSAIKTFAEQMKPHLSVAQETGVTIAIENHSSNLVQTPDSMKWLAEFSGDHLGIALAPYHLPQDEKLISKLIRSLGNRVKMFYAWQHGMGCMKKLPKKQELLQLPGRGTLDFQPLLETLSKINYQGWTEIFMHPVPRGIPILDTTAKVTDEINHARKYLAGILEKLPLKK